MRQTLPTSELLLCVAKYRYSTPVVPSILERQRNMLSNLPNLSRNRQYLSDLCHM